MKPGTHLFEAAKERGTSLYMINSVIPMLPQKISNGICSLNPNVDRLTKSCFIEFDKNGKVVNHKFVNSVIRSRKKMTYEDVNLILEDGIIPEGYEEYYDNLNLMKELSDLLTKVKKEQGKIDFASNEIKVHVDENNQPIQFQMVHQQSAEKIIENFMITANETIASYFPQLPFVYRVHGNPEKMKIDETIHFISSLGYRLNLIENVSSPRLIQNILNTLEKEEEFQLLSNLILRSMKKAEYAVDNIGHFGLASDYYTHFTSPIRRFPDLMVHHLLDLYFDSVSKINFADLESDLRKACAHSSYKERQADAAEKESELLMMATYMKNRIGEEMTGIITNNDSNTIRVRTDDYIYGKILIGDTGKYDPKKYKLGSRVLLKVEDVSITNRSIYFSIVRRLDKTEIEEIQKQKVLIKKAISQN